MLFDRIDRIMVEHTDKETLHVLPITYTGFVICDQQEIGKYPSLGHWNIAKVNVATNSIETSVAIGLMAVVKCGILSQPNCDKERGIILIHEMPISIQSQAQRRGRLCCIKNGICGKITIKNYWSSRLQ